MQRLRNFHSMPKIFMLKYKKDKKNTGLDMREFLGIDKTLMRQTIQD